MNSNPKLFYAIAAILGGSGMALSVNAATATETSDSDAIQEITVTAQRRTENMQDVPITIQALTAETLTQLQVTTFDDYVKYVPNLTSAGAGPGQNSVFMRGLSTSAGGIQGSGANGSFPNVAIYLDDQSGQVPGRNLDIYAADLERIEILEGPQGTLFGAGAQAGVLRYITNKPKLDITEGNVNAGYATTAHGGTSANGDATINIPLIPDTLAVRAVIYDESRGGYINNIPGTFTREPTDKVVTNYFGGVVPPNSGAVTNGAEVGNAINTLTYKGTRVSALYKFNDDWNALVAETYQDMDAEGVFWSEEYDGTGQTLPHYSAQLYNPTYDKDHFTNTSWTLNGKIDMLKLVYTGGYLDRHSDQSQDYTNYSRGFYAGYYQCNYPGYPFAGGKPTTKSPGYCYSPSAFWTDHEQTTHQSHEIRVSTPDDARIRGIGGLFYEKYEVHESTDWFYGTSPNFTPIGPPTENAAGDPYPVTSNNPSVRPLGDSFFDDITRGYKQKAVFASGDFDIIPKVLTFTAGTRYYNIENFEVGSNVGSFGCEIGGPYDGGSPPNPCVNASNLNNLDSKHLDNTYKGFRSRGNLTWHVDSDVMLYYTWSQGFRPGGFNRAASVITPQSPLYGIFTPSLAYAPDYLTNNEIGFKTEWLDHSLQINGAVYREDWKNTQIQIFDPGVTGNLVFTDNGPNYRVNGEELSIVYRPLHDLTLTGSAAHNQSKVVKTLSLIDPKTGAPINIDNPFGALGSPLANSPVWEGNLRARYEVAFNDYHAFGQLGASSQSYAYSTTDQLTTTLASPSPTGGPGGPPVHVDFKNPGFTTYDASLGVGKDAWVTTAYVENLTDKYAWTFSQYSEYVKADTIIRPRTIGVKFSYKFGGQ